MDKNRHRFGNFSPGIGEAVAISYISSSQTEFFGSKSAPGQEDAARIDRGKI